MSEAEVLPSDQYYIRYAEVYVGRNRIEDRSIVLQTIPPTPS